MVDDEASEHESTQPTAEQLALATRVIEQVAEDRGLLTQLSREDKQRFLRAAGRIATPTQNVRKQMERADRKRTQRANAKRKAADELLLAETGIRKQLVGEKKELSHCPIWEFPRRPARHPAAEDRLVVDRELVTTQVIDAEIESSLQLPPPVVLRTPFETVDEID